MRGTVPPAGGLGAFQPAGAGYQAVKWSLWPFDVIVLTDAFVSAGGLGVCACGAHTQRLEILNTDMNGCPLFVKEQN